MACGGQLTSLMITAGSSLLQNSGMTNAIGDKVTSIIGDTPILGDIVDVIGDVAGSVGEWGQEVFENIATMGGELFPGIADAIPDTLFDDITALVAQGAMTEMLDTMGDEILGVDDLGVFAQNLASGRSFTEASNVFLTAAAIDYATEQTDQYLNPITRAVTGQLTAVNKALPSFGSDLANTGTIINLGNLNSFGNPLSLVANLQKSAGGLAVIEPALLNAGISPQALSKVLNTTTDLNGLASQPAVDVLGSGGIVSVDIENIVADPLTGGITTYTTPTLGGLNLGGATAGTVSNKGLGAAVYDALANVKGTSLTTVQGVFGSNINGLDSMQDMLNPSKLFPTSYPSMTSVALPSAGGDANQTFSQAQNLVSGNNTAKIYTGEA